MSKHSRGGDKFRRSVARRRQPEGPPNWRRSSGSPTRSSQKEVSLSVHRHFTAALLSGTLLLTGCGDGGSRGTAGGGSQSPAGDTQPAAPTVPPVATVKMRATDFKLDPAAVRVKEPGAVRFELRNAGQAPHALEVEGPKGEAESKQISAGESTTLDADLSKPGTYTIYCPVGDHKEAGMIGKVVVAG